MPPRRSFLMRHVALHEPDAQSAEKYLRVWNTGELYNHPERFPSLTSEQLFGNRLPLELEIGCSTGEYLCSLAASKPSRNFVGIDIHLKSLYVAVHNASGPGLDNIIFIKAPVQDAYRLMPPDSVHAVYLHFPDPGLHPKFRKRKFIGQMLLDKMHDSLVPGGILSFVTDKEELFRDVLPLFEGDAHFEKTHEERYLLGFEPDVKSRYQLYWERHGGTIYRVELRNVKSDDRRPTMDDH